MGSTESSESPACGSDTSTDIARNVSFLALGQVATTTLAIVFSAALGRTLGAADFGLYFLATSTASFAYVLVEWGQGPVLIRDSARDPARTGHILGTGLAMRAAAAAVVAVPLGIASVALGYDRRARWLLALYFLSAIPLWLSQAFGMVFRGLGRTGKDALFSVVNKGIALVLVLLALARGGRLASIAAAQFVAAVAVLIAAWHAYRALGAPRIGITRDTAWHLWSEGTPIVAMVAASSVQPYLDLVILSKLAPSEVMGWYAVAKNIFGTLIAPAVILGAASLPELSRVTTQPVALREAVRATLRPMLLIGALGAAGTYLFADVAVRIIYGKSGYDPAVTILQVFSPGMFLLFVDILLGNVLLAVGNPKGFAVVKIASVVVSTVLDLLLIPWCQNHYDNGALGVVLGFAISEVVVFAGAIALMPRGTLSGAYAWDGAKALVAAAGTVGIAKALPALPTVFGIPLSIALFAVLALAVGVLRRSDLDVIRNLARRSRGAGSLSAS